MLTATYSPPPPAIAPSALAIRRPDAAPSTLRALAIAAGARWVKAVRREALAAIHDPELRGVFAGEVRRTEANFQRAINALHAGGPEGVASGVHFRAHRAARKAVGA